VDATIPFAVFESELNAARVQQLYADRSFAQRALSALPVSFAVILFAIEIGAPFVVPDWQPAWSIGGLIFAVLLILVVLRKRPSSLSRQWLHHNHILGGQYRVSLWGDLIEIQTIGVALRLPYSHFAIADAGRVWIRLSRDKDAKRYLLLPVVDGTPPRTAPEIRDFLKSRIREQKSRPLPLVADQGLLLPLSASAAKDKVVFEGAPRRRQVLDALGAKSRDGSDEELPSQRGWMSSDLFVLTSEYGQYAALWAAFDSLAVADDWIVARFWSSELLVAARQMFLSPSDFDQAAEWARAADKCASFKR
jgi:hypothetical protein